MNADHTFRHQTLAMAVSLMSSFTTLARDVFEVRHAENPEGPAKQDLSGVVVTKLRVDTDQEAYFRTTTLTLITTIHHAS